MARILNNDGTFLLKAFSTTLDKLSTEEAFELVGVQDIHESYDEATKKPIGKIVAYTYTVFSLDLRGNIKIKVEHTEPVVTAEDLKNSKDDIYIHVPREETSVRPYKVEFGKVHVSIKAPYIELVED